MTKPGWPMPVVAHTLDRMGHPATRTDRNLELRTLNLELLTDVDKSVETYPDGCCQVCGGEPEECAELGSHVWVVCRECGQDMRPEYGRCIDCGTVLPPVVVGSVVGLAIEG